MKRITILLIFLSPLLIVSAFIGVLNTEASSSASAGGVTFTVNSTIDVVDANPGDGVCETAAGNGVCTLRAAVMESNVIPGLNTIDLPAGTYPITIDIVNEDNAVGGDLDILDDLAVNGSGSMTTFIDGNQIDRVLNITGTNAPNVSVSDLTIQNGKTLRINVNLFDVGGGINIWSGSLLFTQGTIQNNQSGTEGGGVFTTGELSIINSEINNNIASGYNGGGIYGDSTSIINIENSTIGNNNAQVSQGGGIYSNGVLTITNSNVEYNFAWQGGALYSLGQLTISNATINNNIATGGSGPKGGGIYFSGNQTALISNTQIVSNSTGFFGGGISGENIILDRSDVSYNSGLYGGGINAKEITITHSLVSNNTASWGAGIYGGDINLWHSSIINNVTSGSPGLGGGLYTSGDTDLSPSKIVNSTFSSNEATRGGAIYVDSEPVSIKNSTIFNNSANEGGGIFENPNQSQSFAILKNTIIATNSGDNCSCSSTCPFGLEIISDGHNLESENTCQLANTGDIINTNPLVDSLQNNGGSTPTHALLPGSPAIDSADNMACPSTDQRDVGRPIDGNGNGVAICDIGAYEFNTLLPFISIVNGTAVENISDTVTLALKVTLALPLTGTATVDYQTADLTAIAHLDYTPISGTITFAPGELTKTLQVPIIDDELDEPDETFAVNLSNPVNAPIADGQGIGTIIDDDDAPELTIGDVAVAEGDGMATFVVTLTAVSAQPITITYQTADLTAIAHLDYTPISGTLTFFPGELTKTLQVSIIGDELDELDETFIVNLSNPVNVTIADGQAVGTILDDDVEQNGYSVYLPFVMR